MKILCWTWEKADGRHFLPEHHPHRCSVTAESCWSTVNAEMSLQTNLAQLKWGVNQRVCGLFTFNKHLFSTGCLSCVWSWGRIGNSMFILENILKQIWLSDTHSKRQMTVICRSREKSCTLSKRKTKTQNTIIISLVTEKYRFDIFTQTLTEKNLNETENCLYLQNYIWRKVWIIKMGKLWSSDTFSRRTIIWILTHNSTCG